MKISLRPLEESELPRASAIHRQAFLDFLKVPERMLPEIDFVRLRFLANPSLALAVDGDGALIGSILGYSLGSLVVVGPVTLQPGIWAKGVGKTMLKMLLRVARAQGCTHAASFTFAHSPMHLNWMRGGGLWPRNLVGVFAQAVRPDAGPAPILFSGLDPTAQARALEDARALTTALFPGLDATREIQAAARIGAGDTVLLRDGEKLLGLAVCHLGERSEAGRGTCHIKFGAVPSGPEAEQRFDALLDACQALAAARGLSQLTAGMNSGHAEAYERLHARGFSLLNTGVALHGPNDTLYKRPGVWTIEDWR